MRRIFSLALAATAAVAPSPSLAEAAPLAAVEQTSLSRDAFSTGLLGRDGGALGDDLWKGADARDLAALLFGAPSRPASPAIGDALRRVLSSPGDAPSDATPALGGAKLKALARAGFIEEAREIEALAAGVEADAASVEAMAVADLLSSDTPAACEKGRRVNAAKDNPFWVKLRVVCYAAGNELDAAELALGILRENGALSATDEAVLAPLASGGAPKSPPPIENALHFAAMKAMKSPVDAGLLARADAGVFVALAGDGSADWKTRLDAGRRAAAFGVMNAGALKALYDAASSDAAPGYKAIRAMTAPDLLRDKAGRVAAEIGAAADFSGLYAAALLYADDIRALEGAIVPEQEAVNFALARLAAGDAVGAERWLSSAAPAMLRGLPEGEAMRFIDLVGVLAALEPAAAQRVATAANVTAAPPRAPALSHQEPSAALAPIVAAAIGAASSGASGQAALAALAASTAAAKGDPVAAAVFKRSLAVAKLPDVARRRAVEEALSAMFPAEAAAPAAVTGEASPVSGRLTPRLKPKRET